MRCAIINKVNGVWTCEVNDVVDAVEPNNATAEGGVLFFDDEAVKAVKAAVDKLFKQIKLILHAKQLNSEILSLDFAVKKFLTDETVSRIKKISKAFSKQDQYTKSCPYCDGIPQLKSSLEVYKKDFGNIWMCPKCRAYVGCHKDTDRAKGFLANEEYRKARREAHSLFDRVWKNREMTRSEAYERMAAILGIQKEDAHIAQLNLDQLQKLIRCLKLRNESKKKD